MSEWSSVIEAIEKLRGLPDDWDGEGAYGLSDDVVNHAMDFAKVCRDSGEKTPSSAVASPRGTIEFTWWDEAHREAEVFPNGDVEWWLRDQGELFLLTKSIWAKDDQ